MHQLREARNIAPNNAEPHALLSQVLASGGRLQEAIAEQRTALRPRARGSDGWNNLRLSSKPAPGKTDDAREDFQHALQIAPTMAQARRQPRPAPAPLTLRRVAASARNGTVSPAERHRLFHIPIAFGESNLPGPEPCFRSTHSPSCVMSFRPPDHSPGRSGVCVVPPRRGEAAA